MNEDDLLGAIGDAIRDSTIRLGDQESVDERRAARAIIAIPEIAAGLATFRITETWGAFALHRFAVVWEAEAYGAAVARGDSAVAAIAALDAKLGGVS